MKIFFLMRHSGYLRNYSSLLQLLADRDHQVKVGLIKIDEIYPETAIKELVSNYSNISYTVFPKREWLWWQPTKFLRGLQTYVRYLDDRYQDANKLRARASSLVPGPIRWLVKKIVGGHGRRMWPAINFLRTIEKAIPLDPFITQFFNSQKPDVFLVTPLIDLRASQLDWLKSAKALKIISGLCVASWDNLSNKSLIQIEPDVVFVWNKIQQQEAVELHRIDPAKIVITGAQCYDRLFARQPSASGAQFRSKVGLPADEPYLLYLCSSRFIAPNEVDFVKQWIGRLRNSGDQLLANIGVLVRPHPQNATQWRNVEVNRYRNVAIYPREGANPIGEDSLNDFYDSMFYSVGTVGINTSPMIESGILNKPVFTILAPEFRDTQKGTLHFHHLMASGLLSISHDLDEHLHQLSQSLADTESHQERIRDFIQSFVRPHGLTQECLPIFAEAVEQLKGKIKLSPVESSRWAILLRTLILPWAILFFTAKKARAKIAG
jgi:hypothetical protein